MRAVWLREFGPPEVLVEGTAADPEPGAGQVVVEATVSGITFVETQIRAGHPPSPALSPKLPVILGNGVGGVVVAVGAGADPGLLGQRVVTSTGGSGGYAERVAVDAGNLIPVPAALDLCQAVALLADGRTALALIEAATIVPGDRVLVEAAAGSVGSLLVQLARAAGAGSVIAVAGGARKLALARELGADVAIDYRQPGWAGEVQSATDGAGIDVAFDGVGGAIGRASFELMARGGRFMLFGLASGSFAEVSPAEALARDVTVVRGAVAPSPARNRELAAAALAEAAAGRLRPTIGQTFPLGQAAAAHAAIEARTTAGKTLLIC